MNKVLVTSLVALTCLCTVKPAFSADNETPEEFVDPDVHRLDSFQLIGTTRIDPKDLWAELGLKRGDPVDDSLVTSLRQKLYALGLFKNVTLLKRKGSAPGHAKLVIEVEDDDRVLGPWAIGGSAGVYFSDPQVESIETKNGKFNYKFDLVSRNTFRALHRARLGLDLDSAGMIRAGRVLYGLPRFAKEGIQFDVEASVVDVRARYLDALGYGGKLQGMWTKSTGDGDLFLGPAMYVNRYPRFGFQGNPESTAGPRVGYTRETRLLGFVPGEGYSYSASILCSVVDYNESLAEANAAYTLNFYDSFIWTLEAKGLANLDGMSSVRGESRFDVPLSSIQWEATQSANLFLRLRAGQDTTSEESFHGSSAFLGIEYFSTGFIASIGFEITQSPRELFKSERPDNYRSSEVR